MAEPYQRVGRGGAGNVYSKKEIEESNSASSVSENPLSLHHTSTSTSFPSLTQTLTTSSSASQVPEYQHTGRGGAGNWVQPSTLPPPPTIPLTRIPTHASASSGPPPLARRAGRGGAGNYVDDSAAEEERKREEEQRMREETEERIRRDVERGLARPERTYAGGVGGSWEMGPVRRAG